MKLLTSIAIIMQNENCKVLTEPLRSQTQLAPHMEQTVEKYNYVIVIIEDKKKIGFDSKACGRWTGKL
jgi:hypothetical protein